MPRFLQPLFQDKKTSLLSIVLIVIMVTLGCGYWERLSSKQEFFDNLWEWIDPIAGIMSFLITLVILYNQAYERWEDNLEKRLTVEYKYQDNTIAMVENAYLAGESDIRQWAQQLGSQMMGGHLDFDMNWDEPKPTIDRDGNDWYKFYKVEMYLTSNPFDEKAREDKIDSFTKRPFKHSEVFKKDGQLNWRRKS